MADYKKPLPQPTPETKPFWDGVKKHELWVQRCKDCRKSYFYPRPFCPRCFSWNVEWTKTSGKGTLYSFVINHRPPPNFQGPYVIAVVELDEGARMMTNLIDVEPSPDKIRCDMPVEVVFEDVTETITLPKFRPVG